MINSVHSTYSYLVDCKWMVNGLMVNDAFQVYRLLKELYNTCPLPMSDVHVPFTHTFIHFVVENYHLRCLWKQFGVQYLDMLTAGVN